MTLVRVRLRISWITWRLAASAMHRLRNLQVNLEWSDFRVLAVGGAGLGSALVEIDIILKLVISVLSLLYVGKKTYDLYMNKK
tara:strand:- start:1963 stop:2211 length:249 start_codon:yes stop_codon:yes gene_type:complete